MVLNPLKQHVTTTTIDLEDWNYMQKHNIRTSHAIRAFIRDHRVAMGDPNADISSAMMRKKLEKISLRLNATYEVLEKVLDGKTYEKLLDNVQKEVLKGGGD